MSDPQVAGRTDVGQRRAHNEDAILVQPPLLAVADGVGGAAKGEIASSMALDAFAGHAARVPDASSPEEARAQLEHAVLEANRVVFELQAERAELAGMSTTLTAAVLLGDGRLCVAHVGDSRAYMLRADGAAEQLTDDHSLVGELVRGGQLTPDEAREHPHRNVITRAIGTDRDVAVDTLLARARPGDWLLLCSDGLTNHVEDAELARTVAATPSAEAASRELVELANSRGGSDNISVVLAQPVPTRGGVQRKDASATLASAGASSAQRAVEISGELDVVPIDVVDVHEREGGAESQRVIGAEDVTPVETEPGEPPAAVPAAADVKASEWSGPRARYMRTLLLASFIVLVAFVASAVTWRQSYFLTEHEDGHVGIDQGFPILGLSRDWRTSDVLAEDLEPADRERLVESHTIRSQEDALQLLEQLPELAGHCEVVGPVTEGEPGSIEDPAC